MIILLFLKTYFRRKRKRIGGISDSGLAVETDDTVVATPLGNSDHV